ncbi:MAG TPA: 2-succinyl-5-enolpyruvyl-6-hydroxy-3-cyclohexene-1-carboxylic-acid synthase [Acidimicrobiales bacterium]|nr:2-succinyl-5-enolpyruvyl-6-hydroxy-3-cyclohexene-1-carboxylic-acid synthase [Acidimicrobiales bacterium]
MSRSVPSPSEAQATFSATLFDEWIEAGLRDVVISPGSRSTPLVLAAAQRDELTLHVRLDERSAGFFALGRALATKVPVVVVVTSGTASTELHACVAEADLAFVPLIVVTADRPPELHGVGAPQTIDQNRLYGAMVRLFEEPGVARYEMASSWRPLANRLWHFATGDVLPAGPAHLNVAFVEPLLATPVDLPERESVAPAHALDEHLPDVASFDVAGQSVLCVVGRGVGKEVIDECRQLDWVVLGDATARGSLPYFDALLRSADFVESVRPELVVRLGGAPASRVLAEQLRAWSVRTVALSGAGFVADPDHLIHETYAGLPHRDYAPLRARAEYASTWQGASDEVGTWLSTIERDRGAWNEPLVARAVVAASNDSGAALVVGSSMPVRDVEWWTPSRQSATYANRGVNGIDGVVSTVLGVAAGSKAIGLVGDLTMLHDVSGLVEGLGVAGGTCVLVVVDNRGGGIFSFLPQASALAGEAFDRLFATPRAHDLEVVASAFGHVAASVTTIEELGNALEKGLSTEGLSVVVAMVPPRDENVRVHEQLNEQVQRLMNESNA